MKKKTATIVLGFFMFLLSIYVLFQGGARIYESWKADCQNWLSDKIEMTFMPGFSYSFQEEKEESESWLASQLSVLFPMLGYVEAKESESVKIEDELTYEMILKQQAEDSERMSEDLLDETAQTASSNTVAADLSLDKLRDFNYLISKFYTVDSTTMVYEEELKADEFLAKDMHIDTSGDRPKVLIFHTHSQEAFADSVSGDPNTSIVGMGQYLAEQLNAKGIKTMHHNGVYDLIDGKLDRSKAYQLAEAGVTEILNQNPSIEVVIDLHRDGVREDLHLVTDINGKQTAKIMFFNGLSRTKTNGDISYLKNPYIQDNLAFSFQMQLASETMYPGLARKIYLKGYRYSLHMMPKSLLIEAGAQTNTVQEMKNAMDLLADILEDVLVK